MQDISDTAKYKVPNPYKFDQVPLDDPRVFSLFHNGRTIGVFQMESPLAQGWCKRIKPNSIEDLAVINALLRPGALESGAADKYADIRNGKEELSYYHDALKPILENTLGQLVFQEQAINIAQRLFGMSEQEADGLRKAIGKKLPELMAQIKKECMEKAKAHGVITEEEAAEIFGWIEKGQRYSFNKSHSVEYSLMSYFTAYQKVHFTPEFYCAWLTYSSEKPEPKEEIKKLVQDAKLMGVEVLPPDIRKRNADFILDGDKKIRFGISHIRSVGDKSLVNILGAFENNLTYRDLITLIPKIKRNVAESLIKSGALDYLGIDRIKMLRGIYTVYGKTKNKKDSADVLPFNKPLTPVEHKYFMGHWQKGEKMGDILQNILKMDVCRPKRVPTIQAKIDKLKEQEKDTNTAKAIWEKIYLGLPLTTSIADDYEKSFSDIKNCIDYYGIKPKTKIKLHVVVEKIHPKKTSDKAKNPNVSYAQLDISDGSASISRAVCWPNTWDTIKDDLQENSVIEIEGRKDTWNYYEQLVIDRVSIIG
jgi:DNA polymerase III alpha subunit